jgi:hypothetical protein
MTRKALAGKAASEALRVRQRMGLGLTDPANPVDIAEKLGIQVWFQKLPSVEGVLIRAPHPVILLSALRPAGRMAFTCAHELAHYWFNHEGHVDAADDGPVLREDSDDEYQANMFAAYLLMPKTTVQFAFAQRTSTPESAAPLVVLAVAHWLGVGYTTLVHHLRYNLSLLTGDRAEVLLRHAPKDIIGHLAGNRTPGTSAFVVDRAWRSRPVDLEVGDAVVLDGPITASGSCVTTEVGEAARIVVIGVQPGTGHIDGGDGWATYVRVRRYRFEGRSIFRHLEEADDE